MYQGWMQTSATSFRKLVKFCEKMGKEVQVYINLIIFRPLKTIFLL